MLKALLLTLILLASCFANDTVLQRIYQLKWENRVILIWANENIQSLKDRLVSNEYEINDRHILWFIINNNEVHTNFKGEIAPGFVNSVNKNYYTKNGNVLVVGKDSDVKDIANELNFDDIYRLIDGMPMRQVEMQR